jgi:putative transposase
VAKIHEKIADIRRDDLHKLSTRLVRENQTIAVEDLNVRGMMANHKLAGASGDSGWGEFVRQLKYKSEWHGRTFVRIGRFYPSSKLCSTCGFKNDSMPLDIREWQCPQCGVMHDRDVNAARNILAAGLAVTACGGSVRPERRQRRRAGSCRRSTNRLAACA